MKVPIPDQVSQNAEQAFWATQEVHLQCSERTFRSAMQLESSTATRCATGLASVGTTRTVGEAQTTHGRIRPLNDLEASSQMSVAAMPVAGLLLGRGRALRFFP